jgi:hypothetical protein
MEMTLIRMDSMLWMGFQRSSVVTTERGFDPMAGCEMAAQLARARENVASRTSSLLGVHGVHSGWVQDGDAHLSVRVHYTGGRGCKWGQQINRESVAICDGMPGGLGVPLGCHILLKNFITGGA